MKIQTKTIHFSADEQLLAAVQHKVSKLKYFFNLISEARVILKLDKTKEKKSRIAEIKIYIPNGIIYIKENCKTFESALSKALVILKVQLLLYKAKRFKKRVIEPK